MSEASTLGSLKQLLVGKPIPSHLARHERLSKVTGLAVLSSDPLSSVAYATEEILRVLVIGGAAALWLVTPIAGVIAALLLVVAFSYRQIEPVLERMKAAGAKIAQPIAVQESLKLRSFFVLAPDDVLVEIVEAKPIPEGAWDE